MNIPYFLYNIGGTCMVEIDFDLYRKYLPYIAEAMMRNGVMANDIEQIYAQSEANYYSLYKDQTIVYSKYKEKYINKRTR